MRLKILFPFLVIILSMAGSFSAAAQTLSFKSDFGAVKINISDPQKITGTYPNYKGRLFGRLEADQILNMVWVQPRSEKKCQSAYDGTYYWGRVVWKISGSSLKGKWAYCQDALGSGGQWHAQLTSGNLSGLSKAPSMAVTDMDIAKFLQFQYGSMGPGGKPKELRADFTCDNRDDVLITHVNQDHPDGPFFDIMMLSRGTGKLIEQSFNLDFGDGQYSLCKGPGGPDVQAKIIGPLEKDEVYNMTGYDGFCGKVIMIDDGMCDSHFLLWSDKGVIDNETNQKTHIVHFRN